MTYNVENLFNYVGRFVRTSATEFERVRGRRTGPRPKEPHKIDGVAQMIRQNDPDVVVIQEVDTVQSLKRFAEEKLKGRYRVFLEEGNDGRGIDIGFLVKKDLAVEVELISHKDRKFTDPVDGDVIPIFSRDAPALVLRKPGEKKPQMIVFGKHGKSQRDRPGDRRSRILRAAQMEEYQRIISEFRDKFGKDVPIFLAGDFNVDIRTSREVDPIREVLVDTAAPARDRTPKEDWITQTFHPRRRRTVRSQMDGIFTIGRMMPFLRKTWVPRYRNPDGSLRPIPETWNQREKNPSDHFPVIADFNLEGYFGQ